MPHPERTKSKPVLAEPQRLPHSTYWPLFTAFGVMLLFWGILANWVVSALGALVFAAGVAGWLSDLNHELNRDDDGRTN